MSTFTTGMLMGGLVGYVIGTIHVWFIAGREQDLPAARRRHPSRDVTTEEWLADDDPRREWTGRRL